MAAFGQEDAGPEAPSCAVRRLTMIKDTQKTLSEGLDLKAVQVLLKRR